MFRRHKWLHTRWSQISSSSSSWLVSGETQQHMIQQTTWTCIMWSQPKIILANMFVVQQRQQSMKLERRKCTNPPAPSILFEGYYHRALPAITIAPFPPHDFCTPQTTNVLVTMQIFQHYCYAILCRCLPVSFITLLETHKKYWARTLWVRSSCVISFACCSSHDPTKTIQLLDDPNHVLISWYNGCRDRRHAQSHSSDVWFWMVQTSSPRIF